MSKIYPNFTAVAEITAKPGKVELLMNLWSKLQQDEIAQNDGILSYKIGRSLRNENVVQIVLVTPNRETARGLMQSGNFQVFISQAMPHLQAKPRIDVFRSSWEKP